MEEDSRAISFISGRIWQLENTLALLRAPSASATSPDYPNSSALGGPGHGPDRGGQPEAKRISTQKLAPAPRPPPRRGRTAA